MDIEQIDLMILSLKEIKKQMKKRDSLSDRSCGDITRDKRMAISNEITYCGHYIDEAKFRFHALVVKNGLANPFKDDYYKDTTFEPSSLHKYIVKRPHPLKIHDK